MIHPTHRVWVVTTLAVTFISGFWRWTSTVTASADESFPARGQIRAEDVNIRAGSNMNYEVLTQARNGDAVTAWEHRDGWYRIALPAAALCYIHSSFVTRHPGRGDQGTVTGNRVNLRARPTIASSILGQVNEGQLITIRQQDGEWLMIVPPDVASGWVHEHFITLLGRAETEPVPVDHNAVAATLDASPNLSSRPMPATAIPTIAADTAHTSGETETSSASVSTALDATAVDMQQPTTAPLVGTVEDLGRLVARPARHKLVHDRRVVAFLVSERYDLNQFLHRPVRAWGEALALPDCRVPLIRVDRIEPASVTR